MIEKRDEKAKTRFNNPPVRFEGGVNINHKKRPSFLMTFVGMARFELATSSSRTKRATGLRYIPFIFVWACKSNNNFLFTNSDFLVYPQ